MKIKQDVSFKSLIAKNNHIFLRLQYERNAINFCKSRSGGRWHLQANQWFSHNYQCDVMSSTIFDMAANFLAR